MIKENFGRTLFGDEIVGLRQKISIISSTNDLAIYFNKIMLGIIFTYKSTIKNLLKGFCHLAQPEKYLQPNHMILLFSNPSDEKSVFTLHWKSEKNELHRASIDIDMQGEVTCYLTDERSKKFSAENLLDMLKDMHQHASGFPKINTSNGKQEAPSQSARHSAFHSNKDDGVFAQDKNQEPGSQPSLG